MALAEGNHSVRFDRLIGEDLEPFLSEKIFFACLGATLGLKHIVVVVVGILVHSLG